MSCTLVERLEELQQQQEQESLETRKQRKLDSLWALIADLFETLPSDTPSEIIEANLNNIIKSTQKNFSNVPTTHEEISAFLRTELQLDKIGEEDDCDDSDETDEDPFRLMLRAFQSSKQSTRELLLNEEMRSIYVLTSLFSRCPGDDDELPLAIVCRLFDRHRTGTLQVDMDEILNNDQLKEIAESEAKTIDDMIQQLAYLKILKIVVDDETKKRFCCLAI